MEAEAAINQLHITFYDNCSRSYMEVQLRTKKMDDIAEIGAANHQATRRNRKESGQEEKLFRKENAFILMRHTKEECGFWGWN